MMRSRTDVYFLMKIYFWIESKANLQHGSILDLEADSTTLDLAGDSMSSSRSMEDAIALPLFLFAVAVASSSSKSLYSYP
jgi:hypothetical protein